MNYRDDALGSARNPHQAVPKDCREGIRSYFDFGDHLVGSRIDTGDDALGIAGHPSRTGAENDAALGVGGTDRNLGHHLIGREVDAVDHVLFATRRPQRAGGHRKSGAGLFNGHGRDHAVRFWIHAKDQVGGLAIHPYGVFGNGQPIRRAIDGVDRVRHQIRHGPLNTGDSGLLRATGSRRRLRKCGGGHAKGDRQPQGIRR